MKKQQLHWPTHLEIHVQGLPFSPNVVATVAEAMSVEDAEDSVDTVDMWKVRRLKIATKFGASIVILTPILQMHMDSGNVLRRDKTTMSAFLPAQATRWCQSLLGSIQKYKEVVNCEENHYYSSSGYDWRLWSSLTNYLCTGPYCCCHRWLHCSKVGHWLVILTLHLERRWQGLNAQNALTCDINQTRRPQFNGHHALYLCQHHKLLSINLLRTSSFPCCYLSINQLDMGEHITIF